MDERKNLPSASQWGRLSLCAGSFQLEQEAERLGQVAHQDSADAASGTAIHAWLAGEQAELSETESTTASLLKERSQEQLERIFQMREPKIKREQRFWMNPGGTPALSGQADLIALYPEAFPRIAVVQDYKCGFSDPDPAETNAQMKILALLVGLNFPTVDEVVVQLISGPYGVTEGRYTVAQLGAVYDEVVAHLRVIASPDAPLNASPEACRYCPAKLICPEVRKIAVRAVKAAAIPLPKEPEKASRILDEAEILAGFVKETKTYYAGLLTEDPEYSIPGYQMVPGNTVREVTDWGQARERLSQYLPIEQLNAAADYRLGGLEKALGKKLGLKGAPLREKMNSILQGLYLENQNASSLKRVKK